MSHIMLTNPLSFISHNKNDKDSQLGLEYDDTEWRSLMMHRKQRQLNKATAGEFVLSSIQNPTSDIFLTDYWNLGIPSAVVQEPPPTRFVTNEHENPAPSGSINVMDHHINKMGSTANMLLFDPHVLMPMLTTDASSSMPSLSDVDGEAEADQCVPRLNSTRLSSNYLPWTEHEQRLFEEGLSIYGQGKWNEIAALVGSRSPLQVKAYARAYHQRMGIHDAYQLDDCDDNDYHDGTKQHEVPLAEFYGSICSPPMAQVTTSQPTTPKKKSVNRKGKGSSSSHSNGKEGGSGSGNLDKDGKPKPKKERRRYEVDPRLLGWGPPQAERIIDQNVVLDVEKEYCKEFFVGNAIKTPERYMKIRKFILDSWQKLKPEYVSKTYIRQGLKDCGDVNAIGRVHDFLERWGAINFGAKKPNRIRQHPSHNRKSPTNKEASSSSTTTTTTTSDPADKPKKKKKRPQPKIIVDDNGVVQITTTTVPSPTTPISQSLTQLVGGIENQQQLGSTTSSAEEEAKNKRIRASNIIDD